MSHPRSRAATALALPLLALLASLCVYSCSILDPNPGPRPLPPGSPAPPAGGIRDTTVTLQHGSTVYSLYCSRCHGDSAQGSKFAPPVLGMGGLANLVRNGKGTMPGFPRMSDAEIHSLELFLAHYINTSPGTGDPGAPQAPGALYRALCSRCHGDSAEGTLNGPRLQGLGAIAATVRNGKGLMPAFPALNDSQVLGLERWLQHFVNSSPGGGGNSGPSTGAEVFKFYCARCHGDSASGTATAPTVQGMGGIGPVVRNGRGTMPAFPTLNVSQVGLVERWLAHFLQPIPGGGGGGPRPAPGSDLYKALCSRCHGDSAQGGALGPKIQGLAGILYTVRNGRGAMPGFPALSDSQVLDLQSWLGHFVPAGGGGGGGGGGVSGSAGQQLYAAYCARCHGAGAEGIGAAPRIVGASGIANVVLNGRGAMPGFPALTSTDIHYLELWLEELANQPPSGGGGGGGTELTGADYYRLYCSRCHGDSAQGIGTAPSLKGMGAILSVVRGGKGTMPGFSNSTLTDSQVSLIESWLGHFVQVGGGGGGPVTYDGGVLYKSLCARCHGDSAQGVGTAPSIQANGGISFTVLNGKGTMPSFPALNSGQVSAIQSWLLDFPLPGTGGGTGGAPPTGLDLYKANCARCHGDSALGIGTAPLIQRFANISSVVLNGKGTMPGFPTMTASQVSLIEQWLAHFPTPGTGGGGSLNGPDYYRLYCSRCHGDSAQGTASGPSIQGIGLISGVVRSGRASMPGFSSVTLTDAQVSMVEAWLLHFQVPGSGPGGTPGTGLSLYQANCARCHGDSAVGIGTAPFIQRFTGIAAAVSNGKGTMPAFPTMSSTQISLIQQWLGHFAPPGGGGGTQLVGSDYYRLYCSRCHGDSAQGVGTAPPLQGLGGILTVVRSGKGTMSSFSSSTLSDAQVSMIQDWLLHFGTPGTGGGAGGAPATGWDIYKANCARCHGDSALGIGTAPAIQGMGNISSVVLNGKGTMPGFPTMTSPQISLVEQWLQHFPPAGGGGGGAPDGAALYAANCARCHGDSTQGILGTGPYVGGMTGIAATVRNGRNSMPAFPAWTDPQISAVEAFMARFAPLDTTTGRGLYQKYCVMCHGAKGQGVPGVSGGNIAGRSAGDIADAVHTGPGAMPTYPWFTSAQINLLAGYIKTIATIQSVAPMPAHAQGIAGARSGPRSSP